jgi:hypothetical protein
MSLEDERRAPRRFPAGETRKTELMSRVIGRSVGAALVGALALASSSCSSGPSEAARTLCTLVGQELGAPPNSSVAFSTMPLITDAKSTGDSLLDVGARHLAAAINQRSAQAMSRADSEIQTECVRLGIWQTYHGSG